MQPDQNSPTDQPTLPNQQPQTPPQPTVFTPTNSSTTNIAQPASMQTGSSIPVDEHKDYVMAFLLSWVLGNFGADRFYLGYTGLGIAKLLTFGGLGVWAIIDTVLLAFGKLKDRQGIPLKGYESNKSWIRILALIHIILAGIFILYIAWGLLFALSSYGSA